MSKIAINQMTFYYSDFYHPIFENVSLSLDTDWKLGLIGRNGRGKSTFFRLLMNELAPVSGTITGAVSVEYFPYEADTGYRNTLDVLKENIGGLRSLELRMEEIVERGCEEEFTEYNECMDRYLALDGFEMESRIRREFASMQLSEELLERDYQTLSGGERTRMDIIALFLRKNRFVLLDEPTNHLDIAGKAELAEYLKRKKGFIIVSHDRDFLDQVVDHILSINKATIEIEKGNYSSWLRNKEQKEQFEFRTRERLVREIAQLERHSEQTRDWAGVANTQKYRFAGHARTNGCQAYMRQAKHAEEQILENLQEKKELLKNFEEAKQLELCQQETEAGWLLRTKELSFAYPNSRVQVLQGVDMKLTPGERLWIKGRNGTGKSTLLKLLAGRLELSEEAVQQYDVRELQSGTTGDRQKKSLSMLERADNLQISFAGQEPLWQQGTIAEHFSLPEQKEQWERFLEFCHCFDLPENFLTRPLETYSSGEQKKIDIARALSEPNQILFLDEPLNYMDTYFREQLEAAILACTPTLIFVEHEERFGKNVATRILELA